jgi:hypothetical protein
MKSLGFTVCHHVGQTVYWRREISGSILRIALPEKENPSYESLAQRIAQQAARCAHRKVTDLITGLGIHHDYL